MNHTPSSELHVLILQKKRKKKWGGSNQGDQGFRSKIKGIPKYSFASLFSPNQNASLTTTLNLPLLPSCSPLFPTLFLPICPPHSQLCFSQIYTLHYSHKSRFQKFIKRNIWFFLVILSSWKSLVATVSQSVRNVNLILNLLIQTYRTFPNRDSSSFTLHPSGILSV